MKALIAIATAVLLMAPAASAQEPAATLSLEEAITLARENNPEYRAQLNDEAVADWGVRSAYADFLPTASVGGGLSYQSGGDARIGSFTSDEIGLSETPDYYFSSYNVGVRLGLSGSTLYAVDRQKASRRSVVAGLEAAGQTLETNVTRQYLVVLRSRDAVDLARSELERAEANLSLAEARYAVESATAIETMQAEVERGRAEVGLLRAEATLANQTVRLLQLIGIDLDREVELTSDLPVFEPRWSVSSLIEAALASQPELEAARAMKESAEAGVGVARSSYWPSLQVSTGLSGFTRRASSDEFLLDRALGSARQQCTLTNQLITALQLDTPRQDCSEIELSEETRADIIEDNSQFPFNFSREPMAVSLGISVPIFQGLSRKQQLEAARAQADDARWDLRARELATRADVETAYRDLQAAYRAVSLEERNRELASQQLRLASERYRLGSAAFIELMEAETLKARADREYLLGVYTFQESLTALEQAVGQSLAIPED